MNHTTSRGSPYSKVHGANMGPTWVLSAPDWPHVGPISSIWYKPATAMIMHFNDVIMSMMASQITSLTIVYSSVYWAADQRKHQISASLAFVRGIRRWPVNSLHRWPVAGKMLPFDDVIMRSLKSWWYDKCVPQRQLNTCMSLIDHWYPSIMKMIQHGYRKLHWTTLLTY